MLILETFVDLRELAAAVRGARRACDLPLIASLTINNEGTSLYGTDPELFTARIDELAPDAIGLNCSEGPRVMLETAEKMVRVTRRPVCIQPNAGVPLNVNGRNIYPTTPAYMAKYAKRMIQSGVRIVGGCCGTTPAHIREIRNEIRALQPSILAEHIRVVVPEAGKTPVPLEKKSAWAARIARGEFVTCVELVPPKGIEHGKLMENALTLKKAGIDAINVPDSPRAQVKMSALMASVLLQQKAGIEAIPHYTCKDKNLLALQADLLGAHALGIRNVLAVTGDPPNMGTYPDATAVFNVDAIGLCRLMNMLNHGYDLGEQCRGGDRGVLHRCGTQSERGEPAAGAGTACGRRSTPGQSSPSPSRCSTPPSLLTFLDSMRGDEDDSRGGGDLAARESAKRGVHEERGPRRVRAGRGGHQDVALRQQGGRHGGRHCHCPRAAGCAAGRHRRSSALRPHGKGAVSAERCGKIMATAHFPSEQA